MKKRMILLLVLVLLFEPWLVSLIRCEILTAKYADADMLEALKDYEGMQGRITTLKVLDYKPYSYCRVYAKSKERACEFILVSDYENNPLYWDVVYQDVVWSSGGYGHDPVWPYIR